MSASVTDINEWRVDHKCAEVVSLHGDGAPENITPRKEFGRRKRGEAATGREVFGWDRRPDIASLPGSVRAAWGIATSTEKSAHNRVRQMARDALDAWEGRGRHVCPSLSQSLAARVAGIAEQARSLAAEAKSLGRLRDCVALTENADTLEYLAATIEAEFHD